MRVGDYRVVYSIQEEEITITVVKIAHRKEVYWSFITSVIDKPRDSIPQNPSYKDAILSII